jgi:hypothetical protein
VERLVPDPRPILSGVHQPLRCPASLKVVSPATASPAGTDQPGASSCRIVISASTLWVSWQAIKDDDCL